MLLDITPPMSDVHADYCHFRYATPIFSADYCCYFSAIMFDYFAITPLF
jgi:hypothetical protein